MQGSSSEGANHPSVLRVIRISIPRIRQNAGRIRIVSGVMAGIFLFAVFIHNPLPLKILAICGLACSGLLIGYSIRTTPIFQAFGISKPDRRILLYSIPALLLGVLFGVLTRHKFGLSTLPAMIGTLALVSPCVGIFEEIIFRGYIQGQLQPAGRIFSLLYASMGHTGYKLLVILSLSEPLQFDLPFLVIWTFIGGTAFGILRDLARSSIPPVIAHAIFDIVLYGGLSIVPVWVWS